jgi:hypothetical protein
MDNTEESFVILYHNNNDDDDNNDNGFPEERILFRCNSRESTKHTARNIQARVARHNIFSSKISQLPLIMQTSISEL